MFHSLLTAFVCAADRGSITRGASLKLRGAAGPSRAFLGAALRHFAAASVPQMAFWKFHGRDAGPICYNPLLQGRKQDRIKLP